MFFKGFFIANLFDNFIGINKKYLIFLSLIFFVASLSFTQSNNSDQKDYTKIENLKIFKVPSLISKYEGKKVMITARFYSLGMYGNMINISSEEGGFVRFLYKDKVAEKLLSLVQNKYYTFYGVIINDLAYDWTLLIEDIK